jgi:PPOX class probable FMN-dependent enzyme
VTTIATRFRQPITSVEQLREIVSPPRDAALRKQIDALDEHCRDFIARSPFVFIATSNAAGDCDVSPKGDAPGFVKVIDDHTLIIPDRRGNQRLDSITNMIENPHVGLLFIIPGVEWTLRVNGAATIVRDDEIRESLAAQGVVPELAIAVDVEEAFLHCPKCFLRAKLWDTETFVPREEQPSFAAILKAQTKYDDVPVEAIAQALAADEKKLY